MKQIVKNVFPYWRSVIVILILLTIQAGCDLALPQYTSQIIDVGIQNNGISHIVPNRIPEQEYEQTLIFLTEEEQKIWESIYEKQNDVYILTEKDEDRLTLIDEQLMASIVLTYQMGHTEEANFRDMVLSSMGDNPVMDFFKGIVKDMSLDGISQITNAEIPRFEMPDKDGNMITYVDVRPMVKSLIDSGDMDMEVMNTMKTSLQQAVDQIGSSALKSMAVLYAIECDERAGVDVNAIQMEYLWDRAARMLAIALLMMAVSIAVSFLASRVGAGVGRDLRGKVFGRVISYSNAEIDRFSSASLITRATNDVQQIQMVTTIMLRMVLYAPIMGIGGVMRVARTGAQMWWIIVLAVLVIAGFVFTLMAIAMPKFKIMQKMVDGLNLVSRELLTGLPVIRAFGREDTEEARFDKANRDLKNTQLFTSRVMAFMMPGMTMIMNCIVVLITWISAQHISNGTMQVGTMTAFITYTMQIVISFLMLTAMSILLPRAGVAADRIQEVLSTEPSILETEQARTLSVCHGLICFEDVSFRYPGAEEEVLSDLSFTAEPGKVTAIIGSTGSGKSTLVNLLPRFYDVTKGRITLDGVDIRELKLKDLRAQIGFVPQKGILFSGSIASNLRFGAPDAKDEEIMLAAEIAQADGFIEEKEGKYESFIAQGGRNVSGGQKQRLAIARAIAKHPGIYVFDDSFSALDMKTDAALREALDRNVAGCTQIIVAQRISTIMDADQILVLDEGRIAGCGTHDELLKHCEVYRQIALSQLSEGELGLDKEVMA